MFGWRICEILMRSSRRRKAIQTFPLPPQRTGTCLASSQSPPSARELCRRRVEKLSKSRAAGTQRQSWKMENTKLIEKRRSTFSARLIVDFSIKNGFFPSHGRIENVWKDVKKKI